MSGFVYKVKVDEHILIKKEIPSPETIEEFLYEINALHSLRYSDHVIRFFGIVVDDDAEYVKGLLIDYAEEGALVDIIWDSCKEADLHIPWHTKERWARQIVNGLADIHESGFVQGDFTLSNIVIDEFGDAKLIDINRRGCPVGWEPPEATSLIESGTRITMYIGVKSDLFQLGMVLWGLAMEEDEPERFGRPLKLGPDVNVPEWYRQMTDICLHSDPRMRRQASSLLHMFPPARMHPVENDVDQGSVSAEEEGSVQACTVDSYESEEYPGIQTTDSKSDWLERTPTANETFTRGRSPTRDWRYNLRRGNSDAVIDTNSAWALAKNIRPSYSDIGDDEPTEYPFEYPTPTATPRKLPSDITQHFDESSDHSADQVEDAVIAEDVEDDDQSTPVASTHDGSELEVDVADFTTAFVADNTLTSSQDLDHESSEPIPTVGEGNREYEERLINTTAVELPLGCKPSSELDALPSSTGTAEAASSEAAADHTSPIPYDEPTEHNKVEESERKADTFVEQDIATTVTLETLNSVDQTVVDNVDATVIIERIPENSPTRVSEDESAHSSEDSEASSSTSASSDAETSEAESSEVASPEVASSEAESSEVESSEASSSSSEAESSGVSSSETASSEPEGHRQGRGLNAEVLETNGVELSTALQTTSDVELAVKSPLGQSHAMEAGAAEETAVDTESFEDCQTRDHSIAGTDDGYTTQRQSATVGTNQTSSSTDEHSSPEVHTSERPRSVILPHFITQEGDSEQGDGAHESADEFYDCYTTISRAETIS